MAKETTLSQDVQVDQKVYAPNSRKAQSVGAIDRSKEGIIALMFVGFSWYVPVGWPVEVEVETPRASSKQVKVEAAAEPVAQEA